MVLHLKLRRLKVAAWVSEAALSRGEWEVVKSLIASLLRLWLL